MISRMSLWQPLGIRFIRYRNQLMVIIRSGLVKGLMTISRTGIRSGGILGSAPSGFGLLSMLFDVRASSSYRGRALS